MRTHLFTGERTMHPAAWHTPESRLQNNDHTWSEFNPYTNVLWIKYLLNYLTTNFKLCATSRGGIAEFLNATVTLKSRLDTRTLPKNGAFGTAQEVLLFCYEQEWVSEEQLMDHGVDTTILSNTTLNEE